MMGIFFYTLIDLTLVSCVHVYNLSYALCSAVIIIIIIIIITVVPISTSQQHLKGDDS